MLQYTYLLEGFRHNNFVDAGRFIFDDATSNYVPQEEYAAMNGLAFFINSDYGNEVCNCIFRSIDVWVPSEKRVVKFKCVVAKTDITPGEQFIVPYNMDAGYVRDKESSIVKEASIVKASIVNEKESLSRRGRPPRKLPINIEDASQVEYQATKHFESGVNNVVGTRNRTQSMADGETKRKTRKSRSVGGDEAVKVDESGEPEKKKRCRGRGKSTKRPRKEESENTFTKAITKEEKQKKPATSKVQVAEVVSHEVLLAPPVLVPPVLVPPEVVSKSELGLNLAYQKADLKLQQLSKEIVDMRTTFGTEKARIIANYDLRLEAKQGQIDELNAVHAREMSELQRLHDFDISGLKAGFHVTISGLRENLAGSEVERLMLEEQLVPFNEERRNSSIISQLKEQDDHGITDARMDKARQDRNSSNIRRQSMSQRAQQQLCAHANTEEAVPSTQQTLPPPRTQLALPNSQILPALFPENPQLTQPPTTGSTDAVVPVVDLDVKAEK